MADYANEIWDMANDLRGSTNASDYKSYILGFIVYRYLSVIQAKKLSDVLGDLDSEAEQTDYQLQIDINKKYLENNFEDCLGILSEDPGYAIKAEDTWAVLLDKAKNKSLTMEDLQNAFIHFDENLDELNNNNANRYYKGLFSDINWNSSGSTEGMANALSEVILKIDSINVYDKNGHDIIGDIYEELISKFSSAAGKKAGEFYTPHMVSKLLAKLTTVDIKTKQKLDIMDFAMGSGALLLTYSDVVPGGHDEGTIHFYGQEILKETYNLAKMNLMIHNVNYKHTTLHNNDTLGKDWPEDGKKMDIISANPPYSARWNNDSERKQDPRFSGYELAPKTKADYAFILHGLYHLKENGTMGVVLPHGVLFRGAKEGKIREKLIENNLIDAVIGLPKKLFHSTGIPTLIMILKKNKDTDDVMFIDASKKFKKNGKQNNLTNDNIAEIVKTYKERKDVDKYAHVASYDEIKENDFNLNIPRYVDTFEPEPDIDLDEVENKISDIDKEIDQAEKEFNDMKADLVETDVNTNDK